MTDDTPDPDLQRFVEEIAPGENTVRHVDEARHRRTLRDVAPTEDRTIYIEDPSPALSELVQIALALDEARLNALLERARNMRKYQGKHPAKTEP
jgi:hypothetical protein